MARIFAPNGKAIFSTKELVPAVCDIDNDHVSLNHEGKLDLDYAGQTELDWNGQYTVTRDGQRVFIDEDGDEWLENQLVLLTDEAG